VPRVIVKNASYAYESLRPSIFEILDSTGGKRIDGSSRVVIKPNLLAPAPPEQAVLTHPLVVRAVVEYVLERGAKPQISDSPAVGSIERVLKTSGIKNALAGLDVEYKEFKSSVTIDAGEPFNRLEIAEDALDADVLINLPKLKTHSQMLLTLGVKNLFGCVVGLRKPEWHLRVGVDRERFAALLVHIYEALRPSLTILDGILAMEGQGPGKGGVPKQLGVLMGSDDALALDITVCGMLGMDADRLLTNKVAVEKGLLTGRIEVVGDVPRVKDFALPETKAVLFGPQRFHGFMRRHLIQRPVSNDDLCKACGECWRYCPAGAITHDRKRIAFDYDKCIRCYCCIEVCPHGALRSEDPLLGRIMKELRRLKNDKY